MGCCASKDKDTLVKKQRDLTKIQDQSEKNKQRMNNAVKVLLLGASDSGKSTLLKQMKLIYQDGFTKDELQLYREIVFNNMIDSMKSIITAMKGRLLIKLVDEDSRPAFDLLHKLTVVANTKESNYQFSKEVAEAIKVCWEDDGVKEAYKRRNEYQLNDSAAYFFNDIDRISHPEYIPTDEDILRTRIKTTEITETKFTVNDKLTYTMVDVGGQRSERKKWIHCFKDVTAIIFMVAISEYDQVLSEDESVNRMSESLTLFESICNMELFTKTSIILFMNKTDIFKKKLKYNSLKTYFPKYKGGDNYDNACNYLMDRFQSVTVKSSDRRVYTHFTCATDTRQIKFVMAAVNDIIIQSTLNNDGLL